MRLTKSFLILIAMLKGIKNSLNRVLKKYFIVSVLLIPFFLMLGVVLSYKLFFPLVSAIISGNRELYFSFISSIMLNITIITFLIYIILINSDNDNNVYNHLIKWLPLTMKEKIIAQLIQGLFVVVITNLCYMIFFYIPSFLMSKASIMTILIYLFFVILQSILVYFLLHSIYLIICRLLFFISKKKIVRELASIILGVPLSIYIISNVSIEKLLVNIGEFKVSLFNFLLPIIDRVEGFNYFPFEIFKYCLLYIFIILFLGIFIMFFFGGIEFNNRNLKLFKYIPRNKSKLLWISLKEIKQIVRSEVNISNFIVLMVVIITLKFVNSMYIDVPTMNILVASLCSMCALNSFGEDRNFNIFSRIIPISYKSIAYGKLIGNIVISILLYILISSLITTNIYSSLYHFINGILYVIFSTIVIYTYGIIVPVKANESFSNIIVFLSFVVFCLLISMVITFLNIIYIYKYISIIIIFILFLIPILYKSKKVIN